MFYKTNDLTDRQGVGKPTKAYFLFFVLEMNGLWLMGGGWPCCTSCKLKKLASVPSGLSPMDGAQKIII